MSEETEEDDPYYTVKELREALLELPDDMRVMLASDAEGNDFHFLTDYSDGRNITYDDGYSTVDFECDMVYVSMHDMKTMKGCDHKKCAWSTGTPVLVLWPEN